MHCVYLEIEHVKNESVKPFDIPHLTREPDLDQRLKTAATWVALLFAWFTKTFE